jgi:hypothetical protein
MPESTEFDGLREIPIPKGPTHDLRGLQLAFSLTHMADQRTDSRKAYFCDCERHCKGYRKKVSRSTHQRHAPYRKLPFAERSQLNRSRDLAPVDVDDSLGNISEDPISGLDDGSRDNPIHSGIAATGAGLVCDMYQHRLGGVDGF